MAGKGSSTKPVVRSDAASAADTEWEQPGRSSKIPGSVVPAAPEAASASSVAAAESSLEGVLPSIHGAASQRATHLRHLPSVVPKSFVMPSKSSS